MGFGRGYSKRYIKHDLRAKVLEVVSDHDDLALLNVMCARIRFPLDRVALDTEHTWKPSHLPKAVLLATVPFIPYGGYVDASDAT